MASKPVIRVAVHGAAGRVGREVLRVVAAAPDMTLTAAIDRVPQDELPALPTSVPYYVEPLHGLTHASVDVVVDFTNAAASIAMAPRALAAGARLVIGSTGFTEDQLAYLDGLCLEHGLSAIVAPNFTIGAVLLTKLAAMAAPYFDYVDLIEEHHEAKIDAPSGTALAIAKAISDARPEGFQRNVPEREPLEGTRGGDYESIMVHSSRMPGRMAHHQVTFGGQGQTLTLRHDTINRECYMPGVLMAVRRVGELEKGLTVGLDRLLDIAEPR